MSGCNSLYPTYQEKFLDCTSPEELAQAVFYEDYAEGPLYWAETSFPIHVYVSDTVSEPSAHAVSVAAEAWNDALGFKALSVSQATLWDIRYSSRKRITDVITVSRFSDSQTSSSFEAIGGKAYPMFSVTGVLYHVDISFADAEFKEVNNLTGDETLYNMAGLFLHELGHALGLQHNRPGDVSSYPADLQPYVGDEDKFSPMYGSQLYGQWQFEERDLQYVRNQYRGSCAE